MRDNHIHYPKMLSSIIKMTIVILCNCIIASGFPQEKPRIDFSHYTTQQGLAHNSGNCFAQDNRGFLWIGCNGGLEKFDGYNFTIYKPESGDPGSLSGIIVWSLYVDKSNSLWVGTIGGGLNKYIRDRDEFISYHHNPDNPNSISSDNISCIFEDLSGRLLIGTKGGGLNQFDRKTEKFVHFKRDPADPNSLKDNNIHDYCIDQSGMIWLGTENGINTFDPETNTCRAYYQEPGDLNQFDETPIISLLRCRSGMIWIGTWRKGLFKYDIKQNRITKYQYDRNDPHSIGGQDMYKIFEDSFGGIWIGTEKGLHKYVPETDNFINYSADPNDPRSLSDNFLRTIFEDQTGVIWLGTNNGGLNKFDLHRKKFIHYTYQVDDPYSLSNTHVFSIHEDKTGVIWIGTREGLNLFNKKNKRFTCYKHDPDNPNSLSNNSVQFVTSGKSSEIWVGTDGGLNKLNTRTGAFVCYQHEPDNPNSLSNENVRALHYDKSGILWIGTWGGGLDKFEPDKNRFTNYPVDINITYNAVLTILMDNEGILWLGTYGKGLVKFNPVTEKLTYFTADPDNPEKLKDNVINYLHKDVYGKIWVGTGGGGLSEFDPQKETFINYDVEDGLPTSEITGILEDVHNNLWISTGKGISNFNRSEGSFTNYDIDDGLQAYVFYMHSCWKSITGEMYFGGTNGFNVFVPDSIKANPYLPQVTISDFQILNNSVKIGEKINGRIILQKPVSETKKIILSHKEYIFSIEFAALHFASPMKNKYAYMLERFDKDWIEMDATRRFVSYTTLKPGDYVFKVKASNNDGKWNPKPVTLKIGVFPPYWQTWWFRVSGLIAILALVFTGYWVRTHNIMERNKQLEEINTKLNKQIIERKRAEDQLRKSLKEKEVLVREIHHRVKNNLQVISSLLRLQSQNIKDKQFLDMFRESQNRVKSMSLIHEKLYQSRDLTMIDFAEYIKALANSLYRSYGVDSSKIVLEIGVGDVSLEIDQAIPCGLIINELVSNSLKYAFPRGWQGKSEISVSLRQTTGDEIELIVSDNGVGSLKDFDFRTAKSLGLHLVTILVEDQLQGEIKLDRRKGTRFQIKFKGLAI